jgi:hypothetical protein
MTANRLEMSPAENAHVQGGRIGEGSKLPLEEHTLSRLARHADSRFYHDGSGPAAYPFQLAGSADGLQAQGRQDIRTENRAVRSGVGQERDL